MRYWQKLLVQVLLSPLSLLYGIIISIRNMLYDTGFLRASKFSIPVISVGNLSIGGAGKSPHIEYLIKLLQDYLYVGVLSRGYNRKTSGFKWVTANDTALSVGDEPLQFKRKFSDISIAVSESRALGIPMMLQHHPELQTILLDDAFQHRQVASGLNILLTAYDSLFTKDYLLPSGRLREWRSGYHRADMIIVSKCPDDLSPKQQTLIISEIKPLKHQRIFFSTYRYGYPYHFFQPNYQISLDQDLDVLLISAIANTAYLLQYLNKEVTRLHQMEFEDHHIFTIQDMDRINEQYQRISGRRKILLTTEKDAMRLDIHRQKLYDSGIPVFILPVQVQIIGENAAEFDAVIKNYLLNFKS